MLLKRSVIQYTTGDHHVIKKDLCDDLGLSHILGIEFQLLDGDDIVFSLEAEITAAGLKVKASPPDRLVIEPEVANTILIRTTR